MRRYEAMFIVKPDLSEDDRKSVFAQINEAVTKNKGNISQSGVWSEKRKLGFAIKKCSDGVYYLMAFSAEPAMITELKRSYKLNENIIRVLIIRKD